MELITLKVRLYKYTKISTGRILGLKDGGSGRLGNFITSYKKDTDKFAAPGLINPVIILFDNDSGRKSVCNPAKAARVSNKPIDPKDPYTRLRMFTSERRRLVNRRSSFMSMGLRGGFVQEPRTHVLAILGRPCRD
jgi:hypothetical protein